MRVTGGPDIREIGSGNIGATNVLRTGRKGLAAATLVCDILKGTAAVLAAAYFAGMMRRSRGTRRLPRPSVSVWLRFKGGKGVATYIGVLIGLAWPGALIFCAIWLVVAGCEPLFLALGPDRQRPDAARAMAARPARRRRLVPASERNVMGQASRQYRPAACRE